MSVKYLYLHVNKDFWEQGSLLFHLAFLHFIILRLREVEDQRFYSDLYEFEDLEVQAVSLYQLRTEWIQRKSQYQ